MRAAYKWRLQNGIYGYLTDENDQYGPFIYEVNTQKRHYYGSTGEGVFSPVNDGQISYKVGGLSEARYKELFATFSDMLEDTYPDVTLLDVSYYYNMENDECVESASSLKCSTTDIIFKVVEVKKGEEPSVTLDEINTSTANGDIEYDMHFTLPDGAKGDVPEIDATANATSIDAGLQATATVTKSGSDEEPVFNFEFGIPRANGINEEGGIDVTKLDTKDESGNATHVDATGVTVTSGDDKTIVTSGNITISNGNDNTIIDADGIETTNVTAVTVNTTIVSTESINDKKITASIVNAGWYKVYKCTVFPSTLRIGVTKEYKNSPYYPENYYIEANFGYKGNSQLYSGDAKYNSLSLLNGSFEGTQCITNARIVSTTEASFLEVYINGSDTSNVLYGLNNVEGCGEIIEFQKDSTSYSSQNRLKLTKGIGTNEAVYTKEIINKKSTFIPSDGAGWYTIYKCDNTSFIQDSGNYTSAKISIIKNWNNSETEGYMLLLTYGGSNGDVNKYDLSQLSGFYNNSYHDITKVRIIVKKDSILELQVYLNKLDYTNTPSFTLTLAEGVGDICFLKNDGTGYTTSGDFTLTKGIQNNIITANNMYTKTLSGTTITTSNITSTGTVTANNITSTGTVNLENATVTLPSATKNDLMPIGSIIMWPTTTAPDNWRSCDGGLIELEAYTKGKKIFYFKCDFNPKTGEKMKGGSYAFSCVNTDNEDIVLVLGTLYTEDNMVYVQEDSSLGNTYYVRLPNFNGKFPLKYNSTINIADEDGESAHTLTIQEMPRHNHSLTKRIARVKDRMAGATDGAVDQFDSAGEEITIENTGGGKPHNNMPPYLAINFIIKCK